jgi:hypothetical protein
MNKRTLPTYYYMGHAVQVLAEIIRTCNLKFPQTNLSSLVYNSKNQTNKIRAYVQFARVKGVRLRSR